MNAADFDTQFDRLTAHFHLPSDKSRETVAMDWFQAVQHYEAVELEHGVTELIRSAQETFWPPLGRMRDAIRGRTAGREKPSGKCATCHGSTWINSAPFISNHMIYEGCVVRCPDCGVPPPNYSAPSQRQGLSATEYREWSQGTQQKQYMPEAQQAKARPEGEISEMKAAMSRLRLKLFGKDAA